MHQCVKNEMKFPTRCRKSWQERKEEVCCSVCRVIFCCSQDRERHEDAEHGRANAKTARHQRQLRKERKPLVCLICCRVFTSGLFVNESCNKVCRDDGTEAAEKLSHVLITIPEWAVTKYLFPNSRKRSWEDTNEEIAKVEIQVQARNVGSSAEDGSPVQESSFTQKTSIHGILTKQRKTDLSVKRDRRVTFSPITAVAITSVESIIKVESGKTRGEPSPDLQTECVHALPVATSSDQLPSTDSVDEHAVRNAGAPFEFSSLMPKDTLCRASFSPFEGHDGKEACVFSPPLPVESTNGSPMMAPQMSSTPVCEHLSERRTPSTLDSPSEYHSSSEADGQSQGIFSSLANVICCAFQALPSVLTQFFAIVNETDESDQRSKKEQSFGCKRRQRHRSATFTPYVPISIKKRRLNRRKVDDRQDPSPIPLSLLQSHSRLN